jgi:hypothetical protein
MRIAFALVTCSLLIASACRPNPQAANNNQPTTKIANDSAKTILLNPDHDIIRYVLEQDKEQSSDRIYFLTITPMDQWGESGSWQDAPAALLDAIPTLKTKYRLANGAYLKQGRVLEKGTDKEAWMKWVAIKRWLTDSEVEVEEGTWSSPLGGGSVSVIYKKVDGKWMFKKFSKAWIS